MGQPKLEEIVVGIMQVANQIADREVAIRPIYRSRYLLGQEVHHRQEGRRIHPILPTDLSDVLLPEAQGNPETAQDEHHRIVLANQVAHLVGLPIKSILIHRSFVVSTDGLIGQR